MSSTSAGPADRVNAVTAWLKTTEQFYAPGYHYDMMHDNPRNEAYRAAIVEAVEDEEDFVLEIGTGSGLLALIAADSACQHVYTVEGNPPVADAAKAVVSANEKEDRITVLSKFSTDIEVHYTADMPAKADVLVAEIFDTGLVGEGVLPSFIDAHKRLVREGARVVPHRGVVYAAGFRSSWLRAMDALDRRGGALGTRGEREASRPGCSPVFQFHAGHALREGWVELITAPVEVLRLEFAEPGSLEEEPCTTRSLPVESPGAWDGIVMWWVLDMNPSGTIQISTSPLEEETRPDGTAPPPRAHWQQGCSVCREQPVFATGDTVELTTHVHGWDIYFSLGDKALPQPAPPLDRLAFPALPRNYLQMLSNPATALDLKSQIKAKHDSGSEEGEVILCLGDGYVGPCAAVAAGCGPVVVLATSSVAVAALQAVLGDGAEVFCIQGEVAAVAQTALAGRGVGVVVCEAWIEGFGSNGNTWGVEEASH